jgi:hypothetical protein
MHLPQRGSAAPPKINDNSEFSRKLFEADAAEPDL